VEECVGIERRRGFWHENGTRARAMCSSSIYYHIGYWGVWVWFQLWVSDWACDSRSLYRSGTSPMLARGLVPKVLCTCVKKYRKQFIKICKSSPKHMGQPRVWLKSGFAYVLNHKFLTWARKGQGQEHGFFLVMWLSSFSKYYVLSDSNPPADTWKIIFVACFVEKHA
jgi:hypothetical protein